MSHGRQRPLLADVDSECSTLAHDEVCWLLASGICGQRSDSLLAAEEPDQHVLLDSEEAWTNPELVLGQSWTGLELDLHCSYTGPGSFLKWIWAGPELVPDWC